MNSDRATLLDSERAELLTCAARLLDRTAVKLDLTPLGCALDVDFLEDVVLFVKATEEHLRHCESADTLPPPANDAHDTLVMGLSRYDGEDQGGLAMLARVEVCGRCHRTHTECSCA
jgi:hypothetical protein